MNQPEALQATATVTATVGEWLQVHHPKHGRVHVSCPVGWRTTATISIHPKPHGQPYGKVRPDDWGSEPHAVPLGPKSLELLGSIVKSKEIPEGLVEVQITSPVPEGKGFASSTSDLVAIATALGYAIEAPFTPEVIHAMAISVEASDATMFPGIVTAKLDRAEVLAVHRATPPVAFVTVIPEAILETEHQPESYPIPEAVRMLDAMQTALTSQDLPTMARLATESGSLAQDRIRTPHWSLVNDIAKEFDGLGIIIGHSGTLSAIITNTTHPHHQSRLDALTKTLKDETGCPIAVAHPDLSGPQTLSSQQP